MANARKPPQRSRRLGSRVGQSIIEYVLMTALLSTLTFGFVKFFTGLFERGLRELPQKAGPCLSNSPGNGGNPC